jgi:hypothetical protein
MCGRPDLSARCQMLLEANFGGKGPSWDQHYKAAAMRIALLLALVPSLAPAQPLSLRPSVLRSVAMRLARLSAMTDTSEPTPINQLSAYQAPRPAPCSVRCPPLVSALT